MSFLIISIIAIFIDRYTKLLAVANLKDKNPYVIIEGVLEFFYSENRGAAFGILQNMQWLFYIITVIVICVIYYVLYKLPNSKKYIPLYMCLCFIHSGAIGNFIDRILYSYVVDFIYVKYINFPIFNIADIYVSVATTLLVACLVFIYKEEDLTFVKQ